MGGTVVVDGIAAHEGDVAIAALPEIERHLPRRLEVGEAHQRVDRIVAEIPHLDDRNTRLLQQAPGEGGVGHPGQDDRISTARQESAHQRLLDIGIITAAADHELVSPRFHHVTDALDRVREE